MYLDCPSKWKKDRVQSISIADLMCRGIAASSPAWAQSKPITR